jgi:putative intracellular protease/amidase
VKPASEPMDFAAAVAESRAAKEAQHQAEKYYAQKGREVAEAEKAYRGELAAEITRQTAKGTAVTAAKDLARGSEHVAALAFNRDLAEALRDAAAQSIWRHTADRRELEQFIDWSKRASFLDMEPPRESSVIGGRRAA